MLELDNIVFSNFLSLNLRYNYREKIIGLQISVHRA